MYYWPEDLPRLLPWRLPLNAAEERGREGVDRECGSGKKVLNLEREKSGGIWKNCHQKDFKLGADIRKIPLNQGGVCPVYPYYTEHTIN